MAETPPGLLSFELLKPSSYENGARLGSLCFPGRQAIETPHYIAISSRGAVPHLSQDTMGQSTDIKGLYTALEDFHLLELEDLERLPLPPPILSLTCPPTDSPLRRFIALKYDVVLILGPRRLPPVDTPASNTYTSISILTSVGFRTLEISDYIDAARKLRPDIVVGCADIVHGVRRAGAGLKRMEKMGERSLAWMKGLLAGLRDVVEDDQKLTSIWAPILTVEGGMQREYLEYLEEEDTSKDLGGVVLYDAGNVDDVPKSLANLPRLALTEPAIPHRILQEIAQGIDIFTIPFITTATDAGVALCFNFPAPASPSSQKIGLGIDMWIPSHATDLSPLQLGCNCYACKAHHRAFVRHLLSAKEMLGWVLLQIHNHAVMDAFFAGIRRSILNGTFTEDSIRFGRVYESELPGGTGVGPRVRGYQFHASAVTKTRQNPPAYRKLPEADIQLNDSAEKLAEDLALIDPEVREQDLEDMGLAR